MKDRKIELGICPICKGNGYKFDSDFSKVDCICEETGKRLFLYEIDKSKRIFDKLNEKLIGKIYWKIDYKDKWLFDRIKVHFIFGLCHYNGIAQELYINNFNRLEPFYSNNDYRLSNYSFPPLLNPLLPF